MCAVHWCDTVIYTGFVVCMLSLLHVFIWHLYIADLATLFISIILSSPVRSQVFRYNMFLMFIMCSCLVWWVWYMYSVIFYILYVLLFNNMYYKRSYVSTMYV